MEGYIMARIIWRSGQMPSQKINNMVNYIPSQTEKLGKRLGDTFFDSVKAISPVDTGNLKASWKKEYTKRGDKFHALVYNDATNERTDFPYPIALNYGFHHYYFGTYLGYKAGLYFKERAEADAIREADREIESLLRAVLRKW